MTKLYEGETALVTGGLGFVGRNVVEGLLDEGVKEVIVVDDNSNSSPDMPEHWLDRVEHIRASVTEEDWLVELKRADTVFHLACKTVLECHRDPVYDNEVNALSTLRMLERLKSMGSDAPNFLYTSSACVYGTTPTHAIDETYPTNPSYQYGVSKLAGEAYTRMYANEFGLLATALRLSNVYGPGQTPQNPYCGVIGLFLDQASSGQPLGVIGDGTQSRDFTYVDDTVEAILKANKSSATSGKVFNVSNGEAISVNDVAREVQNLFPGTEIREMPPRLIDGIHYRQLNSDAIHKAIGWRGRTSLQSGILATALWLNGKDLVLPQP